MPFLFLCVHWLAKTFEGTLGPIMNVCLLGSYEVVSGTHNTKPTFANFYCNKGPQTPVKQT